MTPQEAARELIRRQRCRDSLHSFALNIDIPMVPTPAMMPDEDLLGPAETLMPKHHAVILAATQRCMNRPFGRLLIMAPPGAAKSSYVDHVGIAWELGRKPGSRVILGSYAAEVAERQAGRTQAILRQDKWRNLWPQQPVMKSEAKNATVLSNGSELLAMGVQGAVTSNRASGIVIDDPVAGREEADSPAYRQKTLDAYQDDLCTRLLPGAWIILIMTRWHQQDLAGSILPDDYTGQSGMIKCKDGLLWEVVNIPAKCEKPDDPCGRNLGEYLWPEWFPPEHWAIFEKAEGTGANRTWNSLYQQRPSPDGSGEFTRAMFQLYERGELPMHLNNYGATDAAVTQGGGDFTEQGVMGTDADMNMWFHDWWSGQKSTDIVIEEMLRLASKHKIPTWFDEGGVIDKAIRPAINRRQRELEIYFDLRSLTKMQDKVAKCKSFQARAASGTAYFPNWEPWTHKVIQQLLDLPAGRYDDCADVCGLFGRGIDKFSAAYVPQAAKPRGIRPFSAEWLEWTEKHEHKGPRYR